MATEYDITFFDEQQDWWNMRAKGSTAEEAIVNAWHNHIQQSIALGVAKPLLDWKTRFFVRAVADVGRHQN